MAIILVALLTMQTAILAGLVLAIKNFQSQHRLSEHRLEISRAELARQRETGQVQNILQVLGVLREPDFRKSVMVVRSRLKGRPSTTWDAQDNFHVLLVCSTYNFLGLLLQHEVVPKDLFLQHWGASILDMYGILEEFINRRRRANPHYCDDFLWLSQQALSAQRSVATSGEIPVQPAPDASQALRAVGRV